MRDDAPYGLDDPHLPPDDSAARRRVTPPAVFLIVLSVLNLLGGLFLIVDSIGAKRDPGAVEAQVQAQWDRTPADQKEAVKQIGINSVQDYVNFLLVIADVLVGYGGLTALVGAVALFGSVRMLSLHSYRLAMFGAVLTAVPCVTPCCLLGQIAGVWAILVLMNADVRRAFR